MTSPDASLVLFTKRLQIIQNGEKHIDENKKRSARQYVSRPQGFDTIFGANATRSNKFFQEIYSVLFPGLPPTPTIENIIVSLGEILENKVSANWNSSLPSRTRIKLLTDNGLAISGISNNIAESGVNTSLFNIPVDYSGNSLIRVHPLNSEEIEYGTSATQSVNIPVTKNTLTGATYNSPTNKIVVNWSRNRKNIAKITIPSDLAPTIGYTTSVNTVTSQEITSVNGDAEGAYTITIRPVNSGTEYGTEDTRTVNIPGPIITSSPIPYSDEHTIITSWSSTRSSKVLPELIKSDGSIISDPATNNNNITLNSVSLLSGSYRLKLTPYKILSSDIFTTGQPFLSESFNIGQLQSSGLSALSGITFFIFYMTNQYTYEDYKLKNVGLQTSPSSSFFDSPSNPTKVRTTSVTITLSSPPTRQSIINDLNTTLSDSRATFNSGTKLVASLGPGGKLVLTTADGPLLPVGNTAGLYFGSAPNGSTALGVTGIESGQRDLPNVASLITQIRTGVSGAAIAVTGNGSSHTTVTAQYMIADPFIFN